MNVKDRSNTRIGRLWITKEFRKDGAKYRYKWLCICDCGNKKWISSKHLTPVKGVRSCGCLNREHMQRLGEKRKIKFGLSSKRRLFRRYRSDAKRRDLEFDFSFEDFVEMVVGSCYYCGDKLSNVQKADGSNGDFRYTGLDRVDSSAGYVTSNVVTCCRVCNKAKDVTPKDDFLKWVARVYTHSF